MPYHTIPYHIIPCHAIPWCMTLQNIAKQSMTKRNRQTTTLGTAVLGGFNGGISRGECFCGIEREREQERERERERARESDSIMPTAVNNLPNTVNDLKGLFICPHIASRKHTYVLGARHTSTKPEPLCLNYRQRTQRAWRRRWCRMWWWMGRVCHLRDDSHLCLSFWFDATARLYNGKGITFQWVQSFTH